MPDAAAITDLKKLSDADLFGIIDDYAKQVPLLGAIEKMSVPGVEFKPPWIESAATPTYRSAYAGRDFQDAGITNRTVELKYLDFTVYADRMVAESSSVGVDSYMAIQAERALIGGLREVEKQFLMGTSHNSATGSSGADDIFTSGSYLVDGGMTTGSSCTRLYGINTAECRMLLGNNGQMTIEGVEPFTATDSNGKPFEGYKCVGGFWAAACFIGTHACRMVVNLTAASARDSHCASIIDKFGEGFTPDYFVMNKEAISGIRSGRTATSPTGAPAPYPESAYNIPILQVAITNNQSTVTVS